MGASHFQLNVVEIRLHAQPRTPVDPLSLNSAAIRSKGVGEVAFVDSVNGGHNVITARWQIGHDGKTLASCAERVIVDHFQILAKSTRREEPEAIIPGVGSLVILLHFYEKRVLKGGSVYHELHKVHRYQELRLVGLSYSKDPVGRRTEAKRLRAIGALVEDSPASSLALHITEHILTEYTNGERVDSRRTS